MCAILYQSIRSNIYQRKKHHLIRAHTHTYALKQKTAMQTQYGTIGARLFKHQPKTKTSSQMNDCVS